MSGINFLKIHTRLLLAALCVSVITVIVSTRLATGDFSRTPDAGLSDAQRVQLHNQVRQAFATHYQAWLKALETNKLNLLTLSHRELLADYVPAQPSLAAAVANADIVVGGTARAVQFTAFDGVYVTFAIDRVLKGAPGPIVKVHLAGGLRPSSDWSNVFIAEGSNAPLLLPGDRAILFLERDPESGCFVQSFTGTYLLSSGHVVALQGNPFGSSVAGISEDAFAAQVLTP